MAERRGDAFVLGYHALSADWPSPLAVAPDQFERQLALLARRGYRGVTFHELVTEPAAGPRVAVTFDDAYKSILDLAAPLLDQVGFVATVFVPTAFADSGEPLAWEGTDSWLDTAYAGELDPMSWDDLGGLADGGWEIGSHSRTHPRLTEVADDRLAEELRGSRDDVERGLGRPCTTLAYPYGAHDDRVVAAADDAGYRAAATLPIGLAESSDLRWPRVGIYRVDTERRFRLKVSRHVRRLRASPWWARVRRSRLSLGGSPS
jgi:peptidoglycan/xylan/chitin deacetylase (PgdA/CDA1 family)